MHDELARALGRDELPPLAGAAIVPWVYGDKGFGALWRAAVACQPLTLCKLDVPSDGADAPQATAAAAAKTPALALELAVKARAETGDY